MTPTPTPGGFANASNSLAGSVNSAWGLAPVVGIVLIGVLGVIGSQTLYQMVLHGSSRFAQSLGYAIKGLATALFLGVVSAPLYLLSQLNGESQALAGKVVVGLLVAYLGLVVLGMVGEKAWTLVNRRHEQATGHTLSDRLTPDEEGESA